MRGRYFTVAVVNPVYVQYDELLQVSHFIDAALSFKTVRGLWGSKLVAALVLRGPVAPVPVIDSMFQTVKVSSLPVGFNTCEEWLGARDDVFWIDGEVFTNGRCHPFLSVARKLFQDG